MALFDIFYEDDEDEYEPRRRQPISRFIKEGLYRDQRGKCMYCGRKLDLEDMQVDHKTPISRNGSDNEKNLQLLCAPCNTRKGDFTDGEFRRVYKSVGLKGVKASNGRPPSRPIPLKRFQAVTAANQKRRQQRRRAEDYEYEDDDDEEVGFFNLFG